MPKPTNKKQAVFRELVLGTLVYAVVLGFFNDYTNVLDTKSYSTTFLLAVVIELLTYATLILKRRVASRLKNKQAKGYKVGLVFSVWFILFLSKFVFLAVIDWIFSDSVQISGFVGLLAIVVSMTVVKELIDFIYAKLGNREAN